MLRRNLIGRACGVIAALFVLLWLNGQWFGNLAAATPGGHWGAWLVGGRLDLVYSDLPSQFVAYYPTAGGRILSGLADDPNAFVSKTPPPGFVGRPMILGKWTTGDSGGVGWLWLPRSASWGTSRVILAVPLWCFAVPFVAIAFATERRYRRQLKLDRKGKCRKCGYDRTGLPPGARCPECGKRA